ncbi:DUF3866 family protein [soil metagenome]
MVAYTERTVTGVLARRRGLTRVRLDDGSRAYALTQLTGPVSTDDQVVVNTTAVDRGLGTGGWHVVAWNLTRGAFADPGPGHLMKLRYTGVQVDTGAAEELGAEVPDHLEATPVVVGGLHSQLPVVTAAILRDRPGARIAYVMTDGGALPIALSDVVAELTDRALLVGTVTAGHAFGGDLEALNVASGLVSARHRLGADVVVAVMGPGVAGTNSRLGYTGLEVAPILDAVAWLGGRPIACLRASGVDHRARHHGISHHTVTALDAVRSIVDVAHPPALAPSDARHRWHELDPGDPVGLLAGADLDVRTMGRGPADDPLSFSATAAAGMLAARWLGSTEETAP